MLKNWKINELVDEQVKKLICKWEKIRESVKKKVKK